MIGTSYGQRGDAETARKVHHADCEGGGAMLVDLLERLNLRRL